MTREDCYAALFACLAGLVQSGTVRMASRRLQNLNDLGPAQMPALFLTVGDQLVQPKHGMPPRRRLTAYCYLYAYNPDAAAAAGIQLNALIDAVEQALAPGPGQAQTLGGVVEHCWIEGDCPVHEAPKGQKAAALIPIHMMMP